MALSGPQIRRLDDRLEERCRGLTPHQYLAFLKSPTGAADLEGLISAVVVNKTDLFRDEVQLNDFREHVLAPLVARAGGRPLRLWSAGCSTGEEVATLLMLLAESGASPGSTVLGTDISEAALRRACSLSFTPEQLRRVPVGPRERYFMPKGTRLALVSALRERASFQVHNLMDAPYPRPPEEGGFDVVFCRNVLIYFTVESFHRTVAALADSLAPGGTLVLSSSEPLLQVPPALTVMRTASAFFHVRAGGPRSGEGTPAPRASSTARGETRPQDGGPGMRSPGGRSEDRGLSSGREDAPSTPGERSVEVAVEPGHALASAAAFTEADLLFACVLDGASSGASDAVAERDLRRCLALDPDHAAARYLLGLLLEQCRRPLDAAVEYRRALVSLEEGRSRPVPFFLNPSRLRVACAHAAGRLEPLGGAR
ncbi:methyltransferase domain-containing protein [Myxococcus landrumensis]|uniref:Methyltransferase domain-containing protein n=2 Tax=Myxococcus landrumensis TaxID=2813577 RepID=A0ABX7NI72_9BACT|nr:CheR family methyltransferase [Myxococcus landrumus]QSQ18570.1 methyltransferase domain-containing protein [Myxococcus landrumus]